ncbi:hypothetical protein L6452_38319 [Arctium lappa]|uniref:Uncharacterized protein n=1 Tax=Arctium lappa TaxID=4217 RepID=A0ACB8Y5X3_ARCLA|nr:hypothetical protein L6452_38319 [Arctium lappa]
MFIFSAWCILQPILVRGSYPFVPSYVLLGSYAGLGADSTRSSINVPPIQLRLCGRSCATMTTYLMTIEIDEGWQFMETGITKLKRILEGLPEPQFTCEEYIILYTTIYNMCIQKPPHNYSEQLYDKYKEAFHEYINSTVLPSLRGKHDEFMLRELVKRWTNHKVMVRWLSRFFSYLDRYFIPTWSLPTLTEAGLTCFRDTVYEEFKDKAKYAVIALIDREREGEQIDRALLKNVLDIYVEIGMGEMKYYENDFEKDMLADSAAYYSRKASNCIAEDYGPDYLLKAEDCMRKERERVSHYLHSSSEPKLLEVSNVFYRPVISCHNVFGLAMCKLTNGFEL